MGTQLWVVVGLVVLAGAFLVWRCAGKGSRGGCGCSDGCCGKRKGWAGSRIRL